MQLHTCDKLDTESDDNGARTTKSESNVKQDNYNNKPNIAEGSGQWAAHLDENGVGIFIYDNMYTFT